MYVNSLFTWLIFHVNSVLIGSTPYTKFCCLFIIVAIADAMFLTMYIVGFTNTF